MMWRSRSAQVRSKLAAPASFTLPDRLCPKIRRGANYGCTRSNMNATDFRCTKPLTNLVSAQRILFGTDFPFRTAADHVKGLGGCDFNA
jgi:hypothetical protein